MSLTLTRSSGLLEASWSLLDECPYIIVIVGDLNTQTRWMDVVTSDTTNRWSFKISEESIGHTFDVEVLFCNTAIRGLMMKRSLQSQSKADQMMMRNTETMTKAVDDEAGELTIERPTYSRASMKWIEYSRQPDRWMVNVSSSKNSCYFFLRGSSESFDIPLQLSAGQNYKVTLTGLHTMDGQITSESSSSYQVFHHSSKEFRTELTMGDLRRLASQAEAYCISKHYVSNWFYRNRNEAYFGDIFHSRKGIMKATKKDNSGDQASPINGKISGLFFMANNFNGQPPQESPFGSERFQVSPRVLMDIAPNVYFTDFYCMRGQYHYVTLVLTKPGSMTDRFCSGRLLKLDISCRGKNPFMFWESGKLMVCNVNVELFFTEDIDINDMLKNHGARMTKATAVGRGHTTPGGIPKYEKCPTCNLVPPEGDFIPL